MPGTPYVVATASGAANEVVAAATATGAGDAVFAVINSNATVSGLSDSQGNTYVQLNSDAPADVYFFAATYKGTPGTLTAGLSVSDTVAVAGGASPNTILIFAAAGLTAQPADANPAFASANSAVASQSITPGSAGDLIVMFLALGNTATTYVNGFAKVADYAGAGNPVSAGWMTAAAAAPVTAQANLSPAVFWIVGTASFAIRSVGALTASETATGALKTSTWP